MCALYRSQTIISAILLLQLMAFIVSSATLSFSISPLHDDIICDRLRCVGPSPGYYSTRKDEIHSYIY
ncbi:hypothetical protein DL95DRAFT_378478 [Leptodontidium sp. 2 PMI_412]|nr:hypothetical protein DL95DRAFT_378478 [Leptodontidium sp. 2 PMI_412]